MSTIKHDSLWVACLSALYLAACSPPIKPADPADVADTTRPHQAETTTPAKQHPPEQGPVRVQIMMEAITAINPVPHDIVNGEALKSGDKMALYVEVDRPSYLYVTQVSSDGTPARLFPASDTSNVEVPPKQMLRIPPEGRWFKLDQSLGQENFFVHAAKEAIPPETLDSLIKAELAAIKSPRTRTAVTTAHRPAQARPGDGVPGELSNSTRGITEVPKDEESAAPDGKGIIRRRFMIKHVK